MSSLGVEGDQMVPAACGGMRAAHAAGSSPPARLCFEGLSDFLLFNTKLPEIARKLCVILELV